jgi:rubredoxin
MEKTMTMPVWKCNKCGNTIDVQAPPEICPSCKQKCEFVNVSCYTPDCGGPDSGNIDEHVFAESFKGEK